MILISNDDGIHSEGIYNLADAVKDLDQVTIFAPDSERSAVSHGLTLHKPLRMKKTNFRINDIEAYAVNGTPADCVVLGLYKLKDNKPKLILSGINRGPNIGVDVFYSGTLAGAVEGYIAGLPAVAFSLASFTNLHWETANRVASYITSLVIEYGLPSKMVLNVNIPNLPYEKIKGYKCTYLGGWEYRNQLEEKVDPRKESYFWLSEHIAHVPTGDDSDVKAIRDGFVSVTPLSYIFDSPECFSTISQWFVNQEV